MSTSSIEELYRIEAHIGNRAIGVTYHAIDKKNVTEFIVRSISTEIKSGSQIRDILLSRGYCQLVQIAESNVMNAYNCREDIQEPYDMYRCTEWYSVHGPTDPFTLPACLSLFIQGCLRRFFEFHDSETDLNNRCLASRVRYCDGGINRHDITNTLLMAAYHAMIDIIMRTSIVKV